MCSSATRVLSSGDQGRMNQWANADPIWTEMLDLVERNLADLGEAIVRTEEVVELRRTDASDVDGPTYNRTMEGVLAMMHRLHA
jgi:hypothetical protein